MKFTLPVRRLLWPTDANRASHGERWFSAIGGFVGLYGLLWISGRVLDQQGASLVVGSMGATLVLVFAVPHGALSQPWAVLGGHLVSALIGVSCARWIADSWLAAAAAVGLATGVMYYLRCIHPPGGATALVAVLGGEGVRELGYGFVFQPVLENLLIVLVLAVLVNYPFRHRRYPAVLARPRAPQSGGAGEEAASFPSTGIPGAAVPSEVPADLEGVISHGGLCYALSRLDSFIDVGEEDLMRIYALARQHDRAVRKGAAPAPEVAPLAASGAVEEEAGRPLRPRRRAG